MEDRAGCLAAAAGVGGVGEQRQHSQPSTRAARQLKPCKLTARREVRAHPGSERGVPAHWVGVVVECEHLRKTGRAGGKRPDLLVGGQRSYRSVAALDERQDISAVVAPGVVPVVVGDRQRRVYRLVQRAVQPQAVAAVGEALVDAIQVVGQHLERDEQPQKLRAATGRQGPKQRCAVDVRALLLERADRVFAQRPVGDRQCRPVPAVDLAVDLAQPEAQLAVGSAEGRRECPREPGRVLAAVRRA